ncbi:hypothetical protein GENT5_14010 [Flavobacterium ammoniigenes]|uniref:Superfamily I DNA and/or RNA helicase n=1 Tax=Flavobacterium ammoniigenes TaxID=1751095 RepID=A0ABN6L0E0_9FLAO|nr:AAA domain-containing protein [Flavobacterium ammoniigenes]BDB55096.1 hypothetical protein GENT5_14010 [Flavobacterium ammoniigenes]
MEISEKLIKELQNRLKIGNRRGVHLNAIPANSRYKFDFSRLAQIDKNLPKNFVDSLLSEQPLKFKISWKDNVPDLNSLIEEEQSQLVRITKGFENLINQTEAIESEKGINTFGFGFPILVRRDNLDNKITVSPILIWSLRIKRTKEFNTWEIIRTEDDPIYLNEVLVNHLKNDSNIEIEPIPNHILDDGLINKEELIEICTSLIKQINSIVPDDLKEIFKSKIENITSIGDRNKYEKLPLSTTNSFIEFGGLFSIFEVQKQNIIDDYSELMSLENLNLNKVDSYFSSFQPISSIETDPTQQGILNSMQNHKNLLIQGPPGTGKSQTLTALLINALENNRKTIVVCEKRTALEVLHNSLNEKGLSHHCVLIRDIVKDRRFVVDSVRERVDNYPHKVYSNFQSQSELVKLIEKAKSKIALINSQHKFLDGKILGNNNWTHVVGELIKSIKQSSDYQEIKFDLNDFNYTVEELDSLSDLIEKGEGLYNRYKSITTHSFLNPNKLIGDNPYVIEQKINEDFQFYSDSINAIIANIEIVKSEFFRLRRNDLKQQLDDILSFEKEFNQIELELNSIIEENFLVFTESRRTEFEKELSEIESRLKTINTIFSEYTNLNDILDEEKTSKLSFKIFSVFSSHKRKLIANQSELKKEFSRLKIQLLKSKDFKIGNLTNSLIENYKIKDDFEISILQTKQGFIENIQNEFDSFCFSKVYNESCINYLDNISLEVNQNLSLSISSKQTLINLVSELKKFIDLKLSTFKILSDKLNECPDLPFNFKVHDELFKNVNSYNNIFNELESNSDEFVNKLRNEYESKNLLVSEQGDTRIKTLNKLQFEIASLNDKINSDGWAKSKLKYKSHKDFVSAINELLVLKQSYFDSEIDNFSVEFDWFRFYNLLEDKAKKIIDKLLDNSNWKNSFISNYLNGLLIKNANVNLPTSDDDHKELEVILDGIKNEQLKFVNHFWYDKQIEETRSFERKNNGSISVGNLYLKKQGTRNRRLSLRQIVQYDPNLFTSFFPIILTSPDVASNLFKGMNEFFDIVMFDEASQLRLEDNLPAILKGKQIIIAGDEHQMPPSNYFSKVFDGIIDDEDELDEENNLVIDKNNILLSCESLLDFATELNFEKRHLDFHYRSRHPFLIDFSNHAFYNKRLKPLPNNFEYVPIKYIQVNGTFFDHTNDSEAEMVISILDNNINRLPNGKYPTVGIATLNIAQRNLIKSKILERQKFSKYEEFNNKIIELEEQGLFIKNLENIQGDERDVIILSTTYGISKDGKFSQRFGPINHTKGYKLLNVIITRAKFKIYVCTSIPEQVFMDYKSYLLAEGENNKRAVFYSYLAYSKFISEGNIEGRNQVLQSLTDNTPNSSKLDMFIGEDLESPFEEEVYQALVDNFDSASIIPQMKVGGFRIDIVIDTKLTNVPKIAIECDGANYHSSKEAYLYDIHRQKIIEKQGFVFHRIWSTNWWRNQKRETNKLIDFIKEVISKGNDIETDQINLTSNAFTDEIVQVETILSKSIEKSIESNQYIIDSFVDNIDEIEVVSENNKIKVGSIVKLNYINQNKTITINISENESKKNEVINGIQNVFFKSPLAVSLINKLEGEIVKVGNLDNYVEIIEVIKN